jgi:hypothetical protein
MIALLKFLFTGQWPCRHQWEEKQRQECSTEKTRMIPETKNWFRPMFETTTARYTRVESKCAKCGEIKSFKLQ